MFFNKITDLNHLKNKINKYNPFSFCNRWQPMQTSLQVGSSNRFQSLGSENQLSVSENGKFVAGNSRGSLKIICFNENENRWLLDAHITGTYVNNIFTAFTTFSASSYQYKSKINKLGNVAIYSNRDSNVYIFCRNNVSNTWTQMGQTLQASGRKSFGHSLALNCSGNIIAIGAPLYSNAYFKAREYNFSEAVVRPPWVSTFQGGGVFVYCYNQTNNSWIEYGDYSGMLNSNICEGYGLDDNQYGYLDNHFMGDSVTINDYGNLIATSAPGYPKIPSVGGNAVTMNCLYLGMAGSGQSSFRGKVNIYCYHPPSAWCDKGFWRIQNDTDINFHDNQNLASIFTNGCLTVAISCCSVKMMVNFNKDGSRLAVGMPFGDTADVSNPKIGYSIQSNAGFTTVWEQQSGSSDYTCWKMLGDIIAPINSLNSSCYNGYIYGNWNGLIAQLNGDGDKLLIAGDGTTNGLRGFGEVSFFCYKNDQWISSRSRSDLSPDQSYGYAYFGTDAGMSSDGSIIAISSSRYEYICLFCWNGPKFNNCLPTPTSFDFANTWVAIGPCKAWNHIATSSNGTIQTAVSNVDQQIYVSTNTGNTWTLRGSGTGFTTVAMSSNGAIQTVISCSGIFVSTNTGNTWVLRNSNIRCLTDIAVSADGCRQTVTAYYSGIYYSNNTGNTWTCANEGTLQHVWSNVIMSSNGAVQTSSEFNGLFVSTNFGSSWTKKYPGCMAYLAMTSDGKIQIGTSSSANLICSVDSGQNWNAKPSGIITHRPLCNISMSSDGSRMMALEGNNKLWLSSNTGETWQEKILTTGLYYVKMSSDGSRQFGLVQNWISGYIYMSS
jgi:photosystem II stability/assembly factor-like uncharacterized protein